MKTKIITLFYLLLLGTLVYWGYPIIKERYLSPSDDSESHESFFERFKKDDSEEDDWTGEESFDNAQDEDEMEIPDEEVEYLEITREECSNECSDFDESADIEYCRQVCGLVPTPEIKVDAHQKESERDEEETFDELCNDLSNLKKDYCLKDTAISKMNYSLCEQITDKNVRGTCQNRITEEILNGAGH
ncbi:hypothetical protein ACFL2R_00535 [Patescibacteria group bacterium]